MQMLEIPVQLTGEVMQDLWVRRFIWSVLMKQGTLRSGLKALAKQMPGKSCDGTSRRFGPYY
jgi:hypothetical protein